MIRGKSVAKLFCMLSAVAALALLGFTHGARLAAQSTNTGAVYVLSNGVKCPRDARAWGQLSHGRHRLRQRV